jgi:hypothetical protein
MNSEITAQQAAAGAAAGLAGTFLIQGLLAASQKWAPQSLPPIKQDPGEFMVEKAEKNLPKTVRENIPERLEKAAAKSLALGYGTTFGGLYAASRPETKSLLLEGSALGLAAGNRTHAAGGDEATAGANRRADTQPHCLRNCDSRFVSLSSPALMRSMVSHHQDLW